MRNTIILGTLLALFGLVAVAQASDHSGSRDQDRLRVSRDVSNDGRGDRHDRYERKHRSRDRHDESREHRGESREGHAESTERSNRR